MLKTATTLAIGLGLLLLTAITPSLADCQNSTAVAMAKSIKAAANKVNGSGYEIDDVANFNKVAGDIGVTAPEGTVTILAGVGKGVGLAAIDKDGCVISTIGIPRAVWDAIADKLGGVQVIKADVPGI